LLKRKLQKGKDTKRSGAAAESVGKKLRKYSGLMENDADVEIHKKRGFPHPLGKVTPKPV
jgi:hypothetical protein